jgi:SHS2 domain-containing protein
MTFISPHNVTVYLDESGDLGWKFDAPYRKGGSSKHLTICAIIAPYHKQHLPGRMIKKLYQKIKWPTDKEMKWSSMQPSHKHIFTNSCENFFSLHEDIRCLSITVYKPNVREHIRQDANKLYNYMVKLLLIEEIRNYHSVKFIPDPRSIKVSSGDSLCDYLQTELWFEEGVKTKIDSYPIESSSCKGLQFTDMMAGIIQQSYEDNKNEQFLKVEGFIKSKILFPSKKPILSTNLTI